MEIKTKMFSPNHSVFSGTSAKNPKQMWFVKKEKTYATRVKLKFLQKINVYKEEDEETTKIYIEPIKKIRNTVESVTVTKPQYTQIMNDIDINYFIGLTIEGFFVFQIGFPEYDGDTLAKSVITLK